jgi:hypothetical protein
MKINAINIILAGLLCFGCSTYKKIPSPRDFPVSVKGLYCKVVHNKREIAQGEIIVVDTNRIVLLGDSAKTGESRIISINKSEVDTMKVYIASTTNNPGAVIAWATFMPLLSISHGMYAVFSFPVNLVFSSMTIAYTTAKYYGFIYPRDISWDELKKFARFPQGWPEGLSPGEIK